VNLGATVNSLLPDFVPSLSRNRRQLFFTSQRFGTADIFISHRQDVHDDFAWGPPVRLPAPVNGASFDAGSSYFEPSHGRPQLYFASDRANGGGIAGLDIYVAELRGDGTWTTPELVAEVSSGAQDSRPAIRADGLELIFTSTREGNADLYASRRDRVWEPWSAPEKILVVNTGAEETQATLSANRRTLYFASTRPGGSGASDLYASTRKRRGHDH
jgi:Tol biopolymer transport system component